MNRSVIEQDLIIEGNISSKQGEIEIKGRVTGDLDANTVEIRPGGQVQGAIQAEIVRIEGSHAGTISCGDLVLDAEADVKADVTARTLVSEKGARLNGKVQITGA